MKKFVLLIALIIGVGLAFLMHGGGSSKGSATHVAAAIDYHNKAAAIVNKGEPQQIGLVSPSDWETITSYNKKALAEAEQSDIADMNKYYPGFGDHFRD